ncbi:leucine-rich repeat-containing protein 74A-like isoform X2 [Ostrea edulis]|uniref:leucine-rich repeat-containing protein 74A-like isoform X2 n=1 Tax=Ostrea edulis TaxID=37623 RepID=UPI0020954DC8|nr:leucine-rich repeat-containing protein 74A-like isoform X2 [Ostrea edulis]
MAVQQPQIASSPVKRVISTIPEGFENSPDLEGTVSRLSRNESRTMMSRALSRNLTRASFRMPTLVGGRNSRTFLVTDSAIKTPFEPYDLKTPFDPDDDYDFDFESDDDDSSPSKIESVEDLLKRNYQNICRQLHVTPRSKIIREFGKTAVNLADLNLSNKELKAALLTFIKCNEFDDEDDDEDKNDDEVYEINVSGNRLTTKEISYLTELLTVNKRISNVILSACQLSGEALVKLAEFLSKSYTLQKLDLSHNDLTDKDADAVCKIIQKNESIQELILAHNNLGDSGLAVGAALVENETLKSLDLSWNHIRVIGAVGLANGVRMNSNLETLIVAWNGFGFEGSVALGKLLCKNTSLLHLDLSCNRIHPPALFEIVKGLEKNKCLRRLNLSQNPITAPMTSILLNRLLRAKHSSLQELDLAGVVVDKEFNSVLEKIQKKRMFIVRYDSSLPVNKGSVPTVDPKNIFNIDPIRILYFMKEHLRTIDLFLKFDKDSSNSLTRDEMQFAFEMEGYPISKAALDSVMSYLDTNKDGSVDLLEFIDGERKLKRKLIQEREEEKLRHSADEELQNDHSYSQAFQTATKPKFPPIKK